MLRPCLPRFRIGSSLPLTCRRSLHRVPLLHEKFSNGIPGLLTAQGFDVAWTQYQGLMVEKLNNLTAGTEYNHKDTKDILLKFARDPNAAPLFNHASMAHNNHFFFSAISANPSPMPETLKRELEDSFSSIDTLRQEFIYTASAMFGPGFVWLVKTRDREKKFSLVTTYLAGSPYPGAHYRLQPVDMNTEDKTAADAHRRVLRTLPVNSVGAHGPHSQAAGRAPGGVELIPVLCVNTWEHVWLTDYGIGNSMEGGKKAFMESWWEKINWATVAENATVETSRPQFMR